jgi:hypothetical protein
MKNLPRFDIQLENELICDRRIGTQMAHILWSLSLCIVLVALAKGLDLRTITCNPYIGQWDCWYTQTCGNNLYECDGGSNDAPPFPAQAFGWVIFGCIAALAIVVGGVAILVICICRKCGGCHGCGGCSGARCHCTHLSMLRNMICCHRW